MKLTRFRITRERVSVFSFALLLVLAMVFIGAYLGVGCVVRSLFENDNPKVYKSWQDVQDNELLVQLVPRSATHITRRDSGGFRVYQCDVTCKVSLKGLKDFADEHGYSFGQVESEDMLPSGMSVQSDCGVYGLTYGGEFFERTFLCCEFCRKTRDGLLQCFQFVYDKSLRKLYCRYFAR